MPSAKTPQASASRSRSKSPAPSAKKVAATPKPAAKKAKSPSAATTEKKKTPSKSKTPAAAAAVVPKASSSSKKSPQKKEEDDEDDVVEEIEALELSDELKAYFEQFLFEMLVDSSAVHNVIRVQYLQMYAIAAITLAAAFSPAVKPLPMFTNVSPVTQGVAGAFALAQAFSLTAAAQTSYSGMKKSLQYNMIFHLVFAFVVIVLQDAKSELNVQLAVAISCLNVGLNMWACYFKEPTISEDDGDEEA